MSFKLHGLFFATGIFASIHCCSCIGVSNYADDWRNSRQEGKYESAVEERLEDKTLLGSWSYLASSESGSKSERASDVRLTLGEDGHFDMLRIRRIGLLYRSDKYMYLEGKWVDLGGGKVRLDYDDGRKETLSLASRRASFSIEARRLLNFGEEKAPDLPSVRHEWESWRTADGTPRKAKEPLDPFLAYVEHTPRCEATLAGASAALALRIDSFFYRDIFQGGPEEPWELKVFECALPVKAGSLCERNVLWLDKAEFQVDRQNYGGVNYQALRLGTLSLQRTVETPDLKMNLAMQARDANVFRGEREESTYSGMAFVSASLAMGEGGGARLKCELYFYIPNGDGRLFYATCDESLMPGVVTQLKFKEATRP